MPLAFNQAQSRSALSPKQPLQLQASSGKWQHAHWRKLKWLLSISLHHQDAIDTAKLQLWTVAQSTDTFSRSAANTSTAPRGPLPNCPPNHHSTPRNRLNQTYCLML